MDGEVPNIKRWIVFYPIYINSKKTIAEGRRISASKACENPTCIEIGDCCSHLKLPFAIEVCYCSALIYFLSSRYIIGAHELFNGSVMYLILAD
ncbi:hypothetical protein HHK36_027462 [Tetracentron sinense]|uniref:Signal recognition particle 19 kDa protein n=1 Tax=Tetracentron sinense TaxID=13715 RepID=A0A835D4F9_TETSI|nr:hypothetical protein HHK36_027462 [Tetracentron sinense]